MRDCAGNIRSITETARLPSQRMLSCTFARACGALLFAAPGCTPAFNVDAVPHALAPLLDTSQ